MRKALIVILGLLSTLPSYAVSGLKLTCTFQGLTPGARVWLEVEPQYQGTAVGDPARGGFKDVGPAQAADAKHVWQFQVPVDGGASASAYRFEFPPNVASGDRFGSILLKTRFRIDDPARPRQNGYGEVIEQTFAMPTPAGATELSRCLLVRQDGDRLTVGTAADCRDSTFAKTERNGIKIRKGTSGK